MGAEVSVPTDPHYEIDPTKTWLYDADSELIDQAYMRPQVYEGDERTTYFLGWQYKCNFEYFQQTLKDEIEVIFWYPYMWLVFIMTCLQLMGAFFPVFTPYAFMIKFFWDKFVGVTHALAINYWANFNVLANLWGVQYAYCDKMMFKYFLYHTIRNIMPNMDPTFTYAENGDLEAFMHWNMYDPETWKQI